MCFASGPNNNLGIGGGTVTNYGTMPDLPPPTEPEPVTADTGKTKVGPAPPEAGPAP